MPLPSPVADFPDLSGVIESARTRAASQFGSALARFSNPGASTLPPAQSGGSSLSEQISSLGQQASQQIPQGDAPPWLRYGNQSAVRNQPLSGELVNAMGFLGDLGITMEVFSGGQGTAAEGGPRVGTDRHDDGRSADALFFRGDEQLDWANPEHQPIFQQIVREAKSRGVTGFGAGPNYMRPGSMHIGFGNPAIWGAQGRGANAPDWLRAAFNGV